MVGEVAVSEMVVRRLIAPKTLPAKQVVKFARWMIERTDLLQAVRKQIRRVHEDRRLALTAPAKAQNLLFSDHSDA